MSTPSLSSQGFTLVELVVTVAIIGILAAVAIPGYNAYVDKVRLTDARETLIRNGQYLERWYADHGTYLNSSNWVEIPFQETDYYTIGFQGMTDGQTYLLRASPKQSGKKLLQMDQDGTVQTCQWSGAVLQCES